LFVVVFALLAIAASNTLESLRVADGSGGLGGAIGGGVDALAAAASGFVTQRRIRQILGAILVSVASPTGRGVGVADGRARVGAILVGLTVHDIAILPPVRNLPVDRHALPAVIGAARCREQGEQQSKGDAQK
jgi:hypothetical protein